MKQLVRITLLLLMSLASGCSFTFQNLEYRRALKKVEQREYADAISHFIKVIKRNPESDIGLESARRAARISLLEVKDFAKAVDFYKHLVVYSKKQDERMEAQKKIANIYFENLGDYQKAIVEYSKLLKLPHDATEEYEFRLAIAKSYFRMNSFYQAIVEADELLTKDLNDDRRFETLLFKASIFQTTKKLDEAITIFSELIKNYPERAKAENVPLNVAVCYEEKDEFKKSIEVLEAMKSEYPDPEFIELKIRRLKQRQANLPGAQGLRK